METLNFVHSISWDEIRSQHKPNNWRIEVNLHLPVFPISLLAKWRAYSNLYNLCDKWSVLHWYSKSSVCSEHKKKYERALRKHNLLELDKTIKEAMKHPREFPGAILYLGGNHGFPDKHPVFCVRPQHSRRLLLITAFSSLKQCHHFLKNLVQLRWVALLGETVKIRSLTATKSIQPSDAHNNLTKEEWKKVLKTHHPRLFTHDPISGNDRLTRIRELVPKLQVTHVILWCVCCFVCERFLAPATWELIKIPCLLAMVAVALQCVATVLSISVRVNQRVILRADWPDIER